MLKPNHTFQTLGLIAGMLFSFLPSSYGQNGNPTDSIDLRLDVISMEEVQLTWTIENNSTLDYIEVEQALQGAPFETIERIPPQGVETQYITYHSCPDPGTNFYRIRMVDKDGISSFSRVQSVWIDGDLRRVRVYPNPISQGKPLNLVFSGKEKLVFSLYGNDGRLWVKKSLRKSGKVKLRSLPAGTYLYVIEGEESVQYGEVVVR